MKICMPIIDDNGIGSKVYAHFGSAPFFGFYDTETEKFEAIDNSNQHHSHGGCTPLALLEGQDVDVVITGGMGRGAIMKLNMGGVKVFQLDGETVKDAAQNMIDGKLTEMTPGQACAGHDCH